MPTRDPDQKLKRFLAAEAPDTDDYGIGEDAPLYGFKEWPEEDRAAVKQWIIEQAARDQATNPFGPPSDSAPRLGKKRGRY